jgi:hypothetical protein
MYNFNINIKQEEIKYAKKKLKKLKIKYNVAADTGVSSYINIEVEYLCDVESLVIGMIAEGIVFTFLNISFNGNSSEECIKILDTTQSIMSKISEFQMNAITKTLSLIIAKVNQQNTQIANLQVEVDGLNEQLCFDVLETTIDICESIDRMDIIEDRIEKVTIQ